MTVEELLDQAAPEWLKAETKGRVILFSRLTLSRNIKGLPFPIFSDSANRIDAEHKVKQAIHHWNKKETDLFTLCPLSALSETEKNILSAQGLLPKRMTDQSMLYVNQDGTTSVFVNGIDHIKMQCQQANGMTSRLWDQCSRLDDKLSCQVEYSFDGEFGYLTASPSLVGTGMKISAVLFLPGVVRTRTLGSLSDRLIKEGFSLVPVLGGLYGEEVPLFEMINAVSIGISEPELVSRMDALLEDIERGEHELRKELIQNEEVSVKDEIWRAIGTLKYARFIGQEEAARCICAVGWGIAEDMIPTGDSLLFQRLLTLSQESWIKHTIHKEEMSQSDECLWRAVLLREEIKKAGL